jgi:hypothetical protein
VAVGDHRFGGTEYGVGPREVGHVHAWGMLDIAYLRALRDVPVEEGQTGVHHLLDESGDATYDIGSPGDFAHARWLARLSYLYHVPALSRTPTDAEEFADVDLAAELAALGPSGAARAASERRRPVQSGTPE